MSSNLNGERLDFLSQPFPDRKRPDNAIAWDSKYSHWKSTIIDHCVKHSMVLVPSSPDLAVQLAVGEIIPKCLDTVLDKMYSDGDIAEIRTLKGELEQKIKSKTYWSSWGYDKVVRSPIKWASQRIFASSPSKLKSTADQRLLLPSVIKSAICGLLEKLYCKYARDGCQILILRSELLELTNAMYGCDAMVCEVLVLSMVAEDLANECIVDGNEAIKLSLNSHGKVIPPTDAELSVFGLRLTEEKMSTQVESLHEQILQQESSAKKLLREKKKTMALQAMRKKKMLEKKVDQLLLTIDKIQTLREKIREMSDNADIVNAMKQGAATLNSKNTEIGDVSNVMEMLNDQLAESTEITDTLANGSADTDITDLENELHDLLNPVAAKASVISSTTSTIDTDEDIDDVLIQLEALKVPAQEPGDDKRKHIVSETA